jgi:protein-tyrosine phosphatase
MSDIPARWNQLAESVSDEDRRATPGSDGMAIDRHLDWDGCFNIRDLGGLRTSDGHTTRWRAIVRADSLNRLSAAGWSKLCAYGIRTVVDLRNESEIQPDAAPRPSTLTTVHVPLDDIDDTAMWQYFWEAGLDGSPLYYQPFLDRKPQR